MYQINSLPLNVIRNSKLNSERVLIVASQPKIIHFTLLKRTKITISKKIKHSTVLLISRLALRVIIGLVDDQRVKYITLKAEEKTYLFNQERKHFRFN